MKQNVRSVEKKPAPLFVGLIGLLVIVAIAAVVLRSALPPTARCGSDECSEGREWIGILLTLPVFLLGLYQYWRAQLWKRAEFLAWEMKQFFADKEVRKALTMIDWYTRHINLHDDPSPDRRNWPLVTRKTQNRALLPHVFASLADGEGDLSLGSEQDSDLASFTNDQVAIRDAYDAFLDGLERFASYLVTGLVTKSDLAPYLRYWIDDVADTDCNQSDMEWTFWILVYIQFYKFSGVEVLFKAFGHDIGIRGDLFQKSWKAVGDSDRKLANRVVGLLLERTQEHSA